MDIAISQRSDNWLFCALVTYNVMEAILWILFLFFMAPLSFMVLDKRSAMILTTLTPLLLVLLPVETAFKDFQHPIIPSGWPSVIAHLTRAGALFVLYVWIAYVAFKSIMTSRPATTKTMVRRGLLLASAILSAMLTLGLVACIITVKRYIDQNQPVPRSSEQQQQQQQPRQRQQQLWRQHVGPIEIPYLRWREKKISIPNPLYKSDILERYEYLPSFDNTQAEIDFARALGVTVRQMRQESNNIIAGIYSDKARTDNAKDSFGVPFPTWAENCKTQLAKGRQATTRVITHMRDEGITAQLLHAEIEACRTIFGVNPVWRIVQPTTLYDSRPIPFLDCVVAVACIAKQHGKDEDVAQLLRCEREEGLYNSPPLALNFLRHILTNALYSYSAKNPQGRKEILKEPFSQVVESDAITRVLPPYDGDEAVNKIDNLTDLLPFLPSSVAINVIYLHVTCDFDKTKTKIKTKVSAISNLFKNYLFFQTDMKQFDLENVDQTLPIGVIFSMESYQTFVTNADPSLIYGSTTPVYFVARGFDPYDYNLNTNQPLHDLLQAVKSIKYAPYI